MANGHGGKRKGSGRRRGSGDKPHLLDYWTAAEVAAYFQHIKKAYKTNPKIATWVGDQISGKAVQPLAGHDGGALFGHDEEAKEKARAARRQLIG